VSVQHLKSFVFLGLLISFSLYSYWLSNREYVWIVPYMADRAPAAVRESKEFQDVVEKPMRVFKREAVAASLAIDSYKGQQKLSFGQFPVTASSGPNLICLEYPYLRLVWVAEGRAVSGKKTRLLVSAPCRIHPRNHDRVSDIPLPFEELYRRPAQDQTFQWNKLDLDLEVDAENVYGDWPRLWELESIEFYKDPSGEGEVLTLAKEEFVKSTGAPILVRF
jgi:hypothetical protein